MTISNGDHSSAPYQNRAGNNGSFPSYQNPAEDTEISIFDAQRYFSENTADPRRVTPAPPVSVVNTIDNFPDGNSVSRFSSASSDGYGRIYRPQSFHATPTASSEASWNSQVGLLTNPPGAMAISMRNSSGKSEKKPGASSRKWIFQRRCPCAGKKSVQVKDKLGESRASAATIAKNRVNGSLDLNQKQNLPNSVDKGLGATNWSDRREMIPNLHRISAENPFPENRFASRLAAASDGSAGFSFPILNQPNTATPPPSVKLHLINPNSPPRDSLEVFQPQEERSWRKSSEFQRKLGNRQSLNYSMSPKCRTPTAEDDAHSDASSDLFEIESFSTQTTSYPHPRDSLDEAPSSRRPSLGLGYAPPITESDCYAPSEVSIDWSVTTAEGFDRGSIAASEFEERSITAVNGGASWKKRGNGLLSCRCEKAVNVGPHPLKFVASGGEETRTTTTLRHVGSLTKPPLGRLSVPFAAK